MLRKLCLLPILTVLLLLVACQDAGTLLPQLDAVSIKSRVISIVQGSILKPGDTIPVSLALSGENSLPDAVAIHLYLASDSGNQKSLADYTPSALQVSTNQIPALSLPALDSGSYRLVFRLSRQGSLLREETITFFYNPETWTIVNLAAYPGAMSPGGDGILDVQTEVPEDSLTWVRWSRGNEVLKTGLLSDDRDRLHFTVPERDGIYTYTVELFPEAPAPGQTYSFRSTCFRDTQVIVSRNTASSLSIDTEYLHRWHFSGTLTDGGRGRPADGASFFVVRGSRFFDFQNEVVGYKLGAGNSFFATRPMLPDFRKDFSPFSIGIRFLPLAEGSMELFSTRSRDGNSGLTLTAKAGDLSARLWGQGYDLQVSASRAVQTGVANQTVLSIARLPSGLQLVLESGNISPVFGFAETAKPADSITKPVPNPSPAASAAPSVAPSAAPSVAPSAEASASPSPATIAGIRPVDYSTEIGSVASAAFILDELELYQPVSAASASWDAFYLSMQRRYNAALQFAHDFPTDSLPAGLSVKGDVRFSQGSLIMAPGASLLIPDLKLGARTLRLEFSFFTVNRDKFSALILESDGMDPVSVGLDGVVRQGEKTAVIPAMVINPLSCSLSPGEQGLKLQSDEFSFPIQGFKSGSAMSIRLVRGEKSSQSLALIWVAGREIEQPVTGLDP